MQYCICLSLGRHSTIIDQAVQADHEKFYDPLATLMAFHKSFMNRYIELLNFIGPYCCARANIAVGTIVEQKKNGVAV